MLDHVLTLIGKLEGGVLPATIDSVREALARLGAETGPGLELAPGLAADIPFRDMNPDQADAAARAALGGAEIDIVAQPAEGRRKRLLVADMESTLIRNEFLEELAAHLGLQAVVAEITRRAMNGEIDFAAALRERVAMLEGLPVAVLEQAAGRMALMPGAATLIATMRRAGAATVLVSGGFEYFTALVRDRLGLDRDIANALVIADGRLTGAVREPVLDRRAKLATLVQSAAALGIPLASTAAVGDGANDIDMIQAAGLGIAFHPKPAVAAIAKQRIDHADLTALLYAQGYRLDEFAAA